jgi:protocatechuate 3,4-dioxygenase beta subunit
VTSSTAADCDPTAAQTEGPFYPGKQKFDNNHDLTMAGTVGQVVYIRGHILGVKGTAAACSALGDARVEIWQACHSGKYNNSKDPNTAPLDPNFKYWGETFTDANGEYLFKTIIPGSYPADTDWVRPPHIHYKVAKLGYRELTTQMYFKGEALNEKDLILQNTPENERGDLIVDFKPVTAEMVKQGFEANALIGEFNLTLVSVRA